MATEHSLPALQAHQEPPSLACAPPVGLQRIVVIGTSGSGKSTLAEHLSELLTVPFVELDALNWEPNWTNAAPEVFRARVAEAVSGEAWVLAGNYSSGRDLAWSQAETIIWLDYAYPVVIWRVVWRTLRRVILREHLWNGNYERLGTAFLSKDSIILWALTSYHKKRRQYAAVMQQPPYPHLTFLRHRSPRQTRLWLKQLKAELATG